MDKPEAIEAEQIVLRMLINLMALIKDKGQPGIKARTVIGWTAANALTLLYFDQIGEPLDTCLDLTRQAGASLPKMNEIRIFLDEEQPVTVGATMIRNRSINLVLAQSAKIISDMEFKSRQDVDFLIGAIQAPFNKAEEVASSTMDEEDYHALVNLRAAIVNHLVSTARPLPSMLTYQFAKSLPSLVISHKLYGDASRYDEIRAENNIIHPAFCPPIGQALSS